VQIYVCSSARQPSTQPTSNPTETPTLMPSDRVSVAGAFIFLWVAVIASMGILDVSAAVYNLGSKLDPGLKFNRRAMGAAALKISNKNSKDGAYTFHWWFTESSLTSSVLHVNIYIYIYIYIS